MPTWKCYDCGATGAFTDYDELVPERPTIPSECPACSDGLPVPTQP